MIPVLRFGGSGSGITANLSRLVASRMLLQANSGGGKSRAIRSLLEETHGQVQQIIFDPEGEFATLREKFDYVLAAKHGGDVQASPRTAKLLCRRLVELGASAVLDLYELSLFERREFVKVFLTELMALPRDLWRPILVVIDEAHVFVPERGSGESQSGEAVIALCTQGRKRGFCAVLATQRISKLHKDAAAELLNKMIGRTGLDIDMDRAAKELGFDKESRAKLAKLDPGQFFVYGPAISNTVALVRTGDVKTTHPEAGAAGATASAPRAKVQAMLAKLVDLPKEAEAEARTVADLTRENTSLKSQLTKAQKAAPVPQKVVDQAAIDRAVEAAVRIPTKRVEMMAMQVGKAARQIEAILQQVMKAVTEGSAVQVTTVPRPIPAQGLPVVDMRPKPDVRKVVVKEYEKMPWKENGSLPKGERIVLSAIASYPDGVERDQLSVLTGYKRSSRDAYISRASARGHIEIQGDRIVATEDGLQALGPDFEPLPTGDALLEFWMNKLPEGERKVLEVVVQEYPQAVSRGAIDEATGYKRSSRDAYISRLKSRKVITLVGSDIRASETLFS